MLPIELAEKCVKAINADGEERAEVILKVRRGGTPKDFPKGRLLHETFLDGQGKLVYVRAYKAVTVLLYLKKHGLVEIATDDAGMCVKEV